MGARAVMHLVWVPFSRCAWPGEEVMLSARVPRTLQDACRAVLRPFPEWGV
jgi:hypothetical protein